MRRELTLESFYLKIEERVKGGKEWRYSLVIWRGNFFRLTHVNFYHFPHQAHVLRLFQRDYCVYGCQAHWTSHCSTQQSLSDLPTLLDIFNNCRFILRLSSKESETIISPDRTSLSIHPHPSSQLQSFTAVIKVMKTMAHLPQQCTSFSTFSRF